MLESVVFYVLAAMILGLWRPGRDRQEHGALRAVPGRELSLRRDALRDARGGVPGRHPGPGLRRRDCRSLPVRRHAGQPACRGGWPGRQAAALAPRVCACRVLLAEISGILVYSAGAPGAAARPAPPVRPWRAIPKLSACCSTLTTWCPSNSPRCCCSSRWWGDPARAEGHVTPITPYHYLVLSAALFTTGLVGVLVRRNIIVVFMSIELMLNAVNINLGGVLAPAPRRRPARCSPSSSSPSRRRKRPWASASSSRSSGTRRR